MAYNYEEFVRAANNAGMLNRFSQADLDAAKTNPEFGYSMLQMYQNRDKATTAEQRLLADETANQLRKSYGVAPGLPASAFGGDTDSVTRGGFGGSFDAKKSSTENTKSQTTTKSKTSTTTGSGPAFDYDPEQDPRMAAYRKTYLREAERAREDAMAKAAAMTGGVPSSYAVGAADQAGNYFVSQLTDKIPELYNDAYNQQLQEWEKALSIYQIMGDKAPQEYLDVLGIKKKKKTSSGGSSGSTGAKPKAPAQEEPKEEQTPGPEKELTKAEKSKKIHEAVANGDITPNQAQALLKQL